jgi:hypothetical protein
MAPRKLLVQSADACGRAEGNIEEHGTASASRALRGLRALACAYLPCTGTGRSPDWPYWWSAQGRCNADACDARLGEVRHQHSTAEAREQCATTGSGVGGGKGGDQGEQAATLHVPDAEPGARVPGVDACTASQPWGHPRWSNAACRHIPKVGAGWGSTSRPELRRGCRVTGIPTTIKKFQDVLCFYPPCPRLGNIALATLQKRALSFSSRPSPLHSW